MTNASWRPLDALAPVLSSTLSGRQKAVLTPGTKWARELERHAHTRIEVWRGPNGQQSLVIRDVNAICPVEKDLEKLAKKLLSMPHKPREESKIGKRVNAKKPKRTRRNP